MYKAPARTRFLGQEMVFVPECHSTMDLIAELARKPKTQEGLVLITHHQTAGRGQRGNQWESQAGMNLTFSLLLQPAFLKPSDQFRLNVAMSVGVAHYLETLFPDQVAVKWPNDVMVDDKKICGILIQNHIAGHTLHESVIGIGLNVNQNVFSIPTATSMRMQTGQTFALESVLHLLLEGLEVCYQQLRHGEIGRLLADYEEDLYWRHEVRTFQHEGRPFLGTITGVDASGRLEIRTSSGLRCFDVKEVEFIS